MWRGVCPGDLQVRTNCLLLLRAGLDPGPLHPRKSPPLWVKDKDSEGGREKESVCVTCLMSYENDHHKEQPYSTNWSQGLEYGGISSSMNKALSEFIPSPANEYDTQLASQHGTSRTLAPNTPQAVEKWGASTIGNRRRRYLQSYIFEQSPSIQAPEHRCRHT